MGDLVSGAFVVPQNPLMRSVGLGDLVGGTHFVVPQNPLLGNTTLNGPVALVSPRKNALRTSLKGLGCGTCAASSLNGMGSFDVTDPINSIENDSSFGVPNYVLALGSVAAFFFLTSRGKGYSTARTGLRKQYKTRARRLYEATAA